MFEFTAHQDFLDYENKFLENDSEVFQHSYLISVSSFLLCTFLYCYLLDSSDKPEKLVIICFKVYTSIFGQNMPKSGFNTTLSLKLKVELTL